MIFQLLDGVKVKKQLSMDVVRSILCAIFVGFSMIAHGVVNDVQDDFDNYQETTKKDVVKEINEAEISKMRAAIKKCQMRNMHGTHDSRLCLLRAQFIAPHIFGKLLDGENCLILYGPTGNGKTMVGQNFAQEVQEYFPDAVYVEIDCSDVKGPYENQGSNYLKEKFDEIMTYVNEDQKVIILFDEVDSIGAKKDSNDLQQEETARTLWCFLSRIKDNQNVFVISTTNIYEKLMAQVKSRHVSRLEVKGPNSQERESYLHFVCESIHYYSLSEKDLKYIVNKTEGLGKRGLKNIIARIRQDENLGKPKDIDTIINEEKKAEESNEKKEKSFWEKAGAFAERVGDAAVSGFVGGITQRAGNATYDTVSAKITSKFRPAESTTTT